MRGAAFLFLLFIAGSAFAQAPAGPAAEVINQARVARVITPANGTPLALGPTRSVYIGVAATCTLATILMDDSVAVTFAAIPAGANFLPIRAKTIEATGTTCTPILGLW